MKLETAIFRTRQVIRRKHLAWATEKCYCGWIGRYARFLATHDLAGSSEHKFERFLTALALKGVSPTTQNQAFNAVLFLYREVIGQPLGNVDALRAKGRVHVRTAPTVEQTAALLDRIWNMHGYPTRLISCLLYGCGLRVSEGLNLRIKDVLFKESRLVIRDAKGGKDRVVALPCSLVSALREQLQRARWTWESDQIEKIPIALPFALARKYPAVRFSWQWAWLFPSKTTCRHPQSGEIVRYRCHESNVQQAVKAAVRQLDLDTVVTPHVLRHAYATHALEQGALIHDLQAAMGHENIETTKGYLHAHADRIGSPLDRLALPNILSSR